jgi:hypothetical protein
LRWCGSSAAAERRFWSSKSLRDFRLRFQLGCSMPSTAAGCRRRNGPAWAWRPCWR